MAKVMSKKSCLRNRIPDQLLNDIELNKWIIDKLPSTYTFEIHKTIWFIKERKVKRVALQFPEGLLIFACSITDIIEKFAECEVIILSDIVYGACCIDDFTAHRLGAEVLIHYGHSCLVPIQETKLCQILYIFVEIKIDSDHFINTIVHSFDKNKKLSFVSTIQFVGTLQLKDMGYNAVIEQSQPLSRGEILGCTSPLLPNDTSALIYLGDGRFHIESALMRNPHIPAFRYDPYSKILSKEQLDHKKLLNIRKKFVDSCLLKSGTFGILLGTLGRQGSVKVMQYLSNRIKLHTQYDHVKILVSEITPEFMLMFRDSIDAYVQIACPRLSIDWGSSYPKPMLTTYEMSVVLGEVSWDHDKYPMDYYAFNSLGLWTPNHRSPKLLM